MVWITKSQVGRRMRTTAASAIALALVVVGVPAAGAGAQGAPDDDGGQGKIQPALQQALDDKGEAAFWIRFERRADLSDASSIEDWHQRGKVVYDRLTDVASRSQGDVRRQLDGDDVSYRAFYATNAIRVDVGSQQLVQQLAERPEVAGLYPTREYELIEPVETKPAHAPNVVEWGIANIDADDVWTEYGVRGEGITVANIDTGVQFEHPALVDDYRGNNGDGTFDHDYNWFDAAGTCADAPCDTDGHGSHTMGTMMGDDGGANQIGVAPDANWIAANGCCPSDAALIASGEWMLAPTDLNGENPDTGMRPHIVNNSWGTQVPSNDPFMEDVLNAWAAAGIFGTWSNGNNGSSCATSGSPGSRIINYSVGAYDINNSIASFSSRGAGQDGEIKPNISAPGVNVRSSVPGSAYANYSGTSMAAPHLAGAVALLWSGAPSMVGDIEGTRALLDDTAIDNQDLQCGGTADDNNVYGEGRLNALALLDAAPVGDTGILEGTVTDAESGEPLAGAAVSITGPLERELTTGDDGTYSTRLTAGDYTVSASFFGYGTQSAEVTIGAGETVTQDFALSTVPSRSVNGTVLDGSAHGWPLYAEVSVEGTDLSTYTRPNTGRYSMSLPEGTYTLRFEAQYPGYETVTETVEVGARNVRLNVDVPVDANECVAAGYQHNFDGVTESFDAGVLPAGWSIVDNVGNGQVWRFDDPDDRGNLTGGEGPFAISDSDFWGSGGEQDTSLVTPVFDMSDDGSPVVGFKQDYNNLGDVADVDVSVDGGATWETVLHQTTDVRGPNQQFIALPQAAGEPEVQIRFHHYEADYDWWWEVDDVFAGNRTCAPVDGGLVVGNVFDRNTGDGVNGATVTSLDAPEESTQTTATPDDPALADGFYWMFSTLTGNRRFQASATNYGTQTRRVDVEPDWATRANFRLRAGLLAVEPADLSATLRLGDRTAERQFTVSNGGGLPVDVEFSERAGDFELLRADGTQLTSDEIAAAQGAPLQNLAGEVSFAAQAESRMSARGGDARSEEPNAPPWTDIADYPTNVMDNRVVNLEGTIYSVGGGTGSASSDAVYAYDSATLAWDPVASLPEARNGMNVAAVDGQIVASGGWGPSGPSTSTWTYDPGADSWTAVAAAPLGRSASGTAVVDGKLHVIGGCTTAACTPMANDVMAYDPAADAWEALGDYPMSVAFPSCGSIDGVAYCSGGTEAAAATANGFSYDSGSDTWTEIADAPRDSWASTHGVANGQLMVVGGVQAGLVTNAGFAYDPGANSWSDLPNANTARYRGGGACGFYKIGGSSGSFNAQPDSEVLPGYTECDVGAADVPWLSIDTTEATLDPGESVTVTVTMSSNVDQPGTYTAAVAIGEDTPYRVDPVDVTMNVTPPRRWGKLAGTVSGVACDGTTDPLPGATVQVESFAQEWTFNTDANGEYARWIDRRHNPLTVIAAKDGYQPEVDRVRIQAGETVRADFDLDRTGCR